MLKSVLGTTLVLACSTSDTSGTVAPKRAGFCSVTTTGMPSVLAPRTFFGVFVCVSVYVCVCRRQAQAAAK